MRLTFKKEKESTNFFNPYPMTNIKADGKHVGYIFNNGKSKWEIRLAIKKTPTTDNPAPFKWMGLKGCADTEPEARGLLKSNWESVQRRNLHQFDD